MPDRKIGRIVLYLYKFTDSSLGEHIIWWDDVINEETDGLPLELEYLLDTELPKKLGFWIWEGYFEHIMNQDALYETHAHGKFRRPTELEWEHIKAGDLTEPPAPTMWERLSKEDPESLDRVK